MKKKYKKGRICTFPPRINSQNMSIVLLIVTALINKQNTGVKLVSV